MIIAILNISSFAFQITNGTYVCSEHFTVTDYIVRVSCCKRCDLKPDAVPQVEENKVIANLRVHVERANHRFIEFYLFYAAIPLNLVGSVNQLWTVACLITNFQGLLIVDNDCILQCYETRNTL